jgi:hypothetical protein
MKLSLTIATLATLLLSAVVNAKGETAPALRGNNRADNYFALITSASGTQAEQETPGCVPSALIAGNVVAMVRDDRFCIKLSYDQVLSSRPELFSHTLHGPAAAGETGPLIYTLDATSTDKMQCFELTADQKKDLDDELWYINIHSEMCLNDDIRRQILPLVSNVGTIVQQLRQQRLPAETAVTEQART